MRRIVHQEVIGLLVRFHFRKRGMLTGLSLDDAPAVLAETFRKMVEARLD